MILADLVVFSAHAVQPIDSTNTIRQGSIRFCLVVRVDGLETRAARRRPASCKLILAPTTSSLFVCVERLRHIATQKRFETIVAQEFVAQIISNELSR